MAMNKFTTGEEFKRRAAEYIKKFEKGSPDTYKEVEVVLRNGTLGKKKIPRAPTMDGLCVFLGISAKELDVMRREGSDALKTAIDFVDTQIASFIQEMTLSGELDRSTGIFICKAKHGMTEEDKSEKPEKKTIELLIKVSGVRVSGGSPG